MGAISSFSRSFITSHSVALYRLPLSLSIFVRISLTCELLNP